MKILIIDDEADIVYTLKEICEYAGYNVYTAQNGLDGVSLFSEHNPDLVIVDYHMPGWDGITTVKKIRSIDDTTAILVLTVDERQEISDVFMEAGATDFAIKPIKAPDLLARIKVNLYISSVQKEAKRAKENVFVDKGISSATLSLIMNYLKKTNEDVTIEDISSSVQLAYQTVHRYVHHLLENGSLEVVQIYGQLGRPKNKYRLREKC